MPAAPLGLLSHNLLALVIAVVFLLVLSQGVVAGILRISNRLLRTAAFQALTDEERTAFRRNVRRKALLWVAVLSLLLLLGALGLSYRGLRAVDLLKQLGLRILAADWTALKIHVPKALGLLVAGLVLDTASRAIASVLGTALGRSQRLVARQEILTDVNTRLRTALRAVILGGTAVFVGEALELPEGVQRVLGLLAVVAGAWAVSRLASRFLHLLVDVFFDLSSKLQRLDSPLRHLANLNHLIGITKRTLDYFVYVEAATWTADQFTPDTWLAKAGRVGIRVIAIFYTSRVVVDLCNLFIREILLGKAEEHGPAAYQQRLTLLPVLGGFLRYGIYFSALVMVLQAASIDPTPLLAGAGVIGVAIGFGSQVFVGDIVAGFFILFENLLLVGDLVEVSDVCGVVEEIGVRVTKIRDDAGVLHSIPNGEVRKVANHSKAYVHAVVDVHVPYEEDLHKVRMLLAATAHKVLAEQDVPRKRIEIKVQELTESAILLRVITEVPPGKDEDLGDELRAAVVQELRAAGIAAPRTRQAVLIDQGVRVGSPTEKETETNDDSGPPSPFSPSSGEGGGD